jgi:diguanylate cyclase (GGDEF)-like protein/PAS domain S-box-containing protein
MNKYQMESKDILDHISDGVYFVDRDRRISYWNKGAEKLTGFGAEEVEGKFCRDNILIHVDEKGCQLCVDQCPLKAAMGDGLIREAEVFLHHKNGHRVPVLVKAVPVRDEHDEIVGAVETFSDNSAKERILNRVSELERAAFHDPLTDLPNRRFLETMLQTRSDENKRYGWPFAVLMMDIDHFKGVNDTFGHDVGDAVLKVVSATLYANCRTSDLVGRWGGEEFLAVVANCDEKELLNIAERYRHLIATSHVEAMKDQLVTISIGGAVANHREEVSTVIKRADEKLYMAKANGRNRTVL